MIEIDDAIAVMSDVSGYDAETLKGASRVWPLPFLRYAIWLFLYESGYHTTRIGKAFGRDHSTVVYGVRQARERIGHASYESDTEIYKRFKLKVMTDEELFGWVFKSFSDKYEGLYMLDGCVYRNGFLVFNTSGYSLLYNLTRLCSTLENELV